MQREEALNAAVTGANEIRGNKPFATACRIPVCPFIVED